MNNLTIFLCIVPAIICALTAAYLVANQMNNWGWFLLATIILTSAVKAGA